MYKAVIFDFDGVIGDTMNDNFSAWQKAFAPHNVLIDKVDYFLQEGMGRFQVARFFINKHGLSPSIDESVVKAKESIYLKENNFKVYPEIYSIFTFLNYKGIPVAVVTGASRDRINKTLDEKLLAHIDILITVDDVKKGKPDPEPYLEAMKRLKLTPAECVVIENARLGIESAKAAGCTCFAVETTLSKEYLQNADEIFPSHHELQKRLMSIFNHVTT